VSAVAAVCAASVVLFALLEIANQTDTKRNSMWRASSSSAQSKIVLTEVQPSDAWSNDDDQSDCTDSTCATSASTACTRAAYSLTLPRRLYRPARHPVGLWRTTTPAFGRPVQPFSRPYVVTPPSTPRSLNRRKPVQHFNMSSDCEPMLEDTPTPISPLLDVPSQNAEADAYAAALMKQLHEGAAKAKANSRLPEAVRSKATMWEMSRRSSGI